MDIPTAPVSIRMILEGYQSVVFATCSCVRSAAGAALRSSSPKPPTLDRGLGVVFTACSQPSLAQRSPGESSIATCYVQYVTPYAASVRQTAPKIARLLG